ncbi:MULTISPECIES: hypothetical protein [unclassified Modicisalibacter]|uniref:hypothetical protein n=1 Tax=unclassified Modicisalibacter TaxID=2679913 RepID=UPI001CCEB8C9|nr:MULTISPECIES: hypothetical protein [unclassified Modicisalibacter]
MHEVDALPNFHLPEQAYEAPSLYGVGAGERRVARESQVFIPDRVLEPEEVGLAEVPIDLLLESADGLRLGVVLHGNLSADEVGKLKHAGIPTLCYDLEQLAGLDVTAEQVLETLSSHERSRDGYWLYSRIAEDELAKALDDLEERREALRAQEVAERRRREEFERANRERRAAMQIRQRTPTDTVLPLQVPSEPHRSVEQDRLAEKEKLRRRLLALVDVHIECWSRNTLATLAAEEERAAALSEAKQGARARLQAYIPAADEIWIQEALSPWVKELAEKGADLAIKIWWKQRSR